MKRHSMLCWTRKYMYAFVTTWQSKSCSYKCFFTHHLIINKWVNIMFKASSYLESPYQVCLMKWSCILWWVYSVHPSSSLMQEAPLSCRQPDMLVTWYDALERGRGEIRLDSSQPITAHAEWLRCPVSKGHLPPQSPAGRAASPASSCDQVSTVQSAVCEKTQSTGWLSWWTRPGGI